MLKHLGRVITQFESKVYKKKKQKFYSKSRVLKPGALLIAWTYKCSGEMYNKCHVAKLKILHFVERNKIKERMSRTFLIWSIIGGVLPTSKEGIRDNYMQLRSIMNEKSTHTHIQT